MTHIHWTDKEFLKLKEQGFTYAVYKHGSSMDDSRFYGFHKLHELNKWPYLIEGNYKLDRLCVQALGQYGGKHRSLILYDYDWDNTYTPLGYFCELELI